MHENHDPRNPAIAEQVRRTAERLKDKGGMTMAEIALVKRVKYAGDVYKRLLEGGFDIDNAVLFLEGIPDADVAPVRHGRWIDAYPDIEPNPMFMYGICSECGFEQGISKYLKYCPDCGAKMDLEG